ncbi:kinase-like protein [Rhizophagus irregularis]|uniref:Kinase-like protein n=1 Tax=Rhizophagus irregularis TaxID=588596 RepID=A0A2I1H5G1_9GLOM|nr:kinase-like protein [Rhizophagus irregularis]
MKLLIKTNGDPFDLTPKLTSSPISSFTNNLIDNVIESEKGCKLCGKSLYQGTNRVETRQFKLCSDCYLISSECIESTLNKSPIPIIYLPWWNNSTKCNACYSKLKFTLDCQKYCENCLILGVEKIRSGNSDLDDFLYVHNNRAEILMEWIPYSQFTNVKEITKGGFGIIYQATWLETIHNAKFIHRDFHRNMLIDLSYDKGHQWQIGDLGLSQPINNIPYIAPEIFRGYKFSKESDVYCVGMIMWKLTTEDTPECYANLMKRCWNANPKKRLLITETCKILNKWYYGNKNLKQFKKAEEKTLFIKKPLPSAIYTSRPLRSFISRCSLNSSKDYTSIELELDIDIKSPNILETKRNIEELDINSYGNSGKHDI